MSDQSDAKLLEPESVGQALGLAVHDLRNPCAAISANIVFVRESLPDSVDTDTAEALGDCQEAALELNQQLEQLASIARWLTKQTAVAVVNGDVRTTIDMFVQAPRSIKVKAKAVDGDPLHAVGGGATLRYILSLICENAGYYARDADVIISAGIESEQGDIFVDVEDGGPAMEPTLLGTSKTLEGQYALKQHPAGRYGKSLGMLAIHLACDAIGARLELTGVERGMRWRLLLRPAD